MNKYLLIIGFILVFTLNSIATDTVQNATNAEAQKDKELSWVDEQIAAILPARVGISDSIISSLIDPMKMKKPTLIAGIRSKLLAPPKLGVNLPFQPPHVIEEPLKLQAIINTSALINGKWYKSGDPVRLYTLTQIKQNSVLLTGKKAQELILFLTKQNNNIKIITK
ncbi:MAG: hypothetical protein PHO27_08500 [Sulfuricurvum sp.]|nr:hypothetical protein [Sulfuricurvum sp.]